MKLYGVGNALVYYRKKDNLSMEQLCKGICSVATLSRIENGEREFDSLISETLLSRLGKTANRYEFVLNDEDYKLYELRYKIESCYKKKKIDHARQFLDEYENTMPKDVTLHQQFFKFYQMMLYKEEGRQEEYIKEGLHEAISMTRNDFLDKTEGVLLYSSIEIKIIYELFLYENYKESELVSLLRFMDRYYDIEEKVENMVPFLYQLVYQYEDKRKYMEMIRISNRAIDIIRSSRSYLHLADFYFQKIKGEEKIYVLSSEWKNRKKNMIEECNELYYLYMIEDNQDKMKQVEKFCGEVLQCQITKPEIL